MKRIHIFPTLLATVGATMITSTASALELKDDDYCNIANNIYGTAYTEARNGKLSANNLLTWATNKCKNMGHNTELCESLDGTAVMENIYACILQSNYQSKPGQKIIYLNGSSAVHNLDTFEKCHMWLHYTNPYTKNYRGSGCFSQEYSGNACMEDDEYINYKSLECESCGTFTTHGETFNARIKNTQYQYTNIDPAADCVLDDETSDPNTGGSGTYTISISGCTYY